MARNIDYNFRDKLLNYIKSEWMKNGQEKFSRTIKEIANELEGKITPTIENKIWRYLTILESGGRIKIIKGEGSQSNEYIFVDEKLITDIAETKEECIDIINDYVQKQNALTQEVINAYQDLSQKLIAAKGEIGFYKQAILMLEPWGITPDGMTMYRVKQGSELPSIIEQLQKENQTNSN